MFDALKGELTKQPHELPAEKLKQAEGLAKILTEFRKVLYLFFYFMAVVAILSVLNTYNSAPEIIKTIVGILLAIFLLFKVRDLIRGKI